MLGLGRILDRDWFGVANNPRQERKEAVLDFSKLPHQFIFLPNLLCSTRPEQALSATP